MKGAKATKLRAISLFTNCGAGDLGYKKAGFSFDVLAEIDPHRLRVAGLNHPGAALVEGDLREMWVEVVSTYRARAGKERPALLAACPPCQGMSTARGGRGSDDDVQAGGRDSRNLLVLPIAEVAKKLRPRLVVVENVRHFLGRKVPHPSNGKGISAARLLVSLLAKDYEVFPFVADLAEFGVPQHRVRTFLTFVRRSEPCLRALADQACSPYPIPMYAADHGQRAPLTLKSVLTALSLPRLDARKAKGATAPGNPLHAVPVMDPVHHAMVKAIPPRSGRSAWENDECPACGLANKNASAAMCSGCDAQLLRPVVKAKNGRLRLIKGFRTSSYRRMRPDQPAATITTASNRLGSDNTIHPWEHRVLSVAECQALQTIPANFDWGTLIHDRYLGLVRTMIGEAVPPRFTGLHGHVLAGLLQGERRRLLAGDDIRCTKARRKLFGKARRPRRV